jgi:hypothetical protein
MIGVVVFKMGLLGDEVGDRGGFEIATWQVAYLGYLNKDECSCDSPDTRPKLILVYKAQMQKRRLWESAQYHIREHWQSSGATHRKVRNTNIYNEHDDNLIVGNKLSTYHRPEAWRHGLSEPERSIRKGGEEHSRDCQNTSEYEPCLKPRALSHLSRPSKRFCNLVDRPPLCF